MCNILFEARPPLGSQKASAPMANNAWERPSVSRLLSFCLYLLRLEFLFPSVTLYNTTPPYPQPQPSPIPFPITIHLSDCFSSPRAECPSKSQAFDSQLPQLAAKSIPCFAAKEEHESWPWPWPSWELRRPFESQWGREFSASSQPCNFTGPLFRIISI